jgi:hypothetical protein
VGQPAPARLFASASVVPHLHVIIPPTPPTHSPNRYLRYLTVRSVTVTCIIHKYSVSTAQTGQCLPHRQDSVYRTDRRVSTAQTGQRVPHRQDSVCRTDRAVRIMQNEQMHIYNASSFHKVKIPLSVLRVKHGVFLTKGVLSGVLIGYLGTRKVK